MDERRVPEASLTVTAAWLGIARFISYALTIVLPLVLVRKLDQHTFGIYKQVFLVVTTLTTLVPLGFAMNAYYFFPVEDRRAVVSNIFTYLVFVGLLVFALLTTFPRLIVAAVGTPDAANYAPLIALCTGLAIVSFILDVVPIANGEARLVSILVLPVQLSRIAFAATAAVFWGTVHSQLWAIMIHSACHVMVLIAYLHRRFPGFLFSQNWPLMRRQLYYTLRLILPLFVLSMQNDLHQYLVSRWYGPEIFAIYANGCIQIPVVQLLIEAVGPLMIRRINELRSLNDLHGIIQLTMSAARKLAIVFFPVSIGLILFGRELIVVLYTERYRDSYPILAINSLVILFNTIWLDPISRAYPEFQGILLRNRLILLAVLCIGVWILTGWLGPLGAIVMVVAINALDRIVMGLYWAKTLGAVPSDFAAFKSIGKIGLAAVLTGFITFAIKQWFPGTWRPGTILITGPALFLMLYLPMLYQLRTFSSDELRSARQAVDRFLARWFRIRRPVIEN